MVLAHLRLVAKISKRALESFHGVALNNFVLCVSFALIGSHSRRTAFWTALPFLIVLVTPMLVVSASEMSEQFPASRSALLPLLVWQRLAASLAFLVLNPVFCVVALVLLAWAGPAAAVGFLFFAIAIQGVTSALRVLCVRLASRVSHASRRRPNLFTARLRELFATLDLWAACILACAGLAYRILAHSPDPAARPVLAVLISLALSTTAQRTFASAGSCGRTRLRLLPLPGWRLLLPYDLALLLVAALLCAPFHFAAGLACTFVAIAAGRWPSIRQPATQRPWRFTSGDPRFCALQILLGVLAGAATAGVSLWFFAAACALYLVSIPIGGRWWDRVRS